MMHARLIDYSSSRQLPTGRRVFSLQAARKVAESYGDQAIVAKCDAAIGVDRQTLDVEQAYLEHKHDNSTARGNASAIDRKIDELFGRMYGVADNQAFGDDDTADKAEAFLKASFPDGLAGLVNQEFEHQLILMETLLERYDADLADHVDTLGLRRHVDRLQVLVPAFRAELEKESGQDVTFADVKAARAKGLDKFAGVVFLVLSTYDDTTNPEHVARREAILAEYHRQNAIIAESYRRREAVEDIDPDTGEPVGDEPADEDVVEPVV